jgi:toxin ParE1/3/4
MTVDKAGPHSWEIVLAASAEADLKSIIRWTAEKFGDMQARRYSVTLNDAISALVEGPTVTGARTRNDIVKGLHSLHVARNGHNGSHLVFFRVDTDRTRIEILRVLHDAMDIARHLPAQSGSE